MQPGLDLAGRYALDARLSSGGMGEVWRATDRRLGRPVAVKVLLQRSLDPGLMRRFQREALVTARLQHPGITVVHDVGVHADQLFIVMELLQGGDLQAKLDAAPDGLPSDEVASLMVEAAEALAAAHAERIVHRDLKPANLFLQTNGKLKICDFGIAWAADFTAGLTSTGQVFGTPLYMSPEQCNGEPLDARSDLYSLGCVLYALLTGQPPFPSGAPLAIMQQHCTSTPPDLRRRRPDVPAALAEAVMALLAKLPADRPSDALAVAARLRAFQRPAMARSRTGAGSVVAAQPTRTAAAAMAAPEGPRPDIERAERYIAAAVDLIPRGIRGREERDEALADLVEACIAIHPARAEQLARSIRDKEWRAELLESIAATRLRSDPLHAEQIARGTPDKTSQAWALVAVAGDYADRDPARSARLLADAERALLARTVQVRAMEYANLAVAYHRIDTARAQRTLGEAVQQARGYSGNVQPRALAEIATAWARIDPAAAEQIASPLRPEHQGNTTLATALANAWAPSDPEHAENLARLVPYEDGRAGALAEVAARCARRDRARADRLLREAADDARATPDVRARAAAVARIASCAESAPAVASQLWDEAEKTVQLIPQGFRINALLTLAAIAANKPRPDQAPAAQPIARRTEIRRRKSGGW